MTFLLGLILVLAFIGCGFLVQIYNDLQMLMTMVSTLHIDEPVEPLPGGMDLLLLKKQSPKKTKRRNFTDKSRDWITAHETASRR